MRAEVFRVRNSIAVFFSLYVNDITSPLHHVDFSAYADYTIIIATSLTQCSRRLSGVISQRISAVIERMEIAINISNITAKIFELSRCRVMLLRSVAIFGEPVKLDETTRYLKVTLDKQLTLSLHIDQVRKKTAQKMGILDALLIGKSNLSVRNGFLHYKHSILYILHYACPTWRSAALTHVRMSQVLQSKCLRLSTSAR
jgi:hypothetical protein